MKIGIIAPSFIPVPPIGYGGTELVIYNLTEGLTRLGHEVVLFAKSGSSTSAQTFKPYIEAENIDFGLYSPLQEKIITCELSSKYAHSMAAYLGVEIIHNHTLTDNIVDIPAIHTLHGPATEASVAKCVTLSENKLIDFVSISKRQQEKHLTLSRNIRFIGNVYNSVDVKEVKWSDQKEEYLLFVGRINWEKGPDMAIRVASGIGMPLVMVVKMSEQFEKDFFKEEVQPLLDELKGSFTFKLYQEPPHDFKFELYRKARCTLFTSQWEEPFGLVMIESMACGTPVVALRRGAAPEVIKNGVTGFVVDTEEEMIEALKDIDKLDPKDCRRHVEKNFSVEKMADDYLQIYRKALGGE